MTFQHVNRRTHLYLSMALIPWFLIYAASSLIFSHADWFREPAPPWTVRVEQDYDRPDPTVDDLRPVGNEILREFDSFGAFNIRRLNDHRVQINRFDFWSATRVTWDPQARRILIEDQQFGWSQTLIRLHVRGGFQQEDWMSDLWAVVVDLVSVGMLLWIVTGLIMWWQLRSTRFWGFIAIGGGLFTFAGFLLAL